MRRRDLALAALALGFAIGMVGCGDGDGLSRRSVLGTVTLGGEPLDQGRIEFRPIGQGTPAGASIERGAYRIDAGVGPTPGTYRVNISSPTGGDVPEGEQDAAPGPGPRGPTERVPAQYNASSTLTAVVKADATNVFDFAMDSSKSARTPSKGKVR